MSERYMWAIREENVRKKHNEDILKEHMSKGHEDLEFWKREDREAVKWYIKHQIYERSSMLISITIWGSFVVPEL